VPAGITAQIFFFPIDGDVAEPYLSAGGRRLHNRSETEAVEDCAIGFMAIGQMTDRPRVVHRGRDDSLAVVAFRVVPQCPAMKGPFRGKPLRTLAATPRIAFFGTTLRAVSSFSPPLPRV